MKDKLLPVLAGVLVLSAGGGLYYIGPRAQSAQVRLNVAARPHVEAAERLLTEYSQTGVRLQELHQQTARLLADPPATTAPADTTPGGFTLKAIKDVDEDEADPERLDDINAVLQTTQHFGDPDIQKLTGPFEQQYQLEAGATAIGEPPQPRVDTSPGGLMRLQTELEQALRDNRQRLDDAWREINEGLLLSERSGDETADGRSHPQVTRMAGIVQYHRAAAAQRDARAERLRAAPHRRRITELAALYAETARDEAFFEQQDLSAVIEKVTARRKAVQDTLSRTQGATQAEQVAIRQLQQQLVSATTAAEAASAQLQQLEAKGYPFDDVAAFLAFRKAYRATGKAWRDAETDAANIRAGALLGTVVRDTDDLTERDERILVNDIESARTDAEARQAFDRFLGTYYQPAPGEQVQFFDGIAQHVQDAALLDAQRVHLTAHLQQLDEQLAQLAKFTQAITERRIAAAARATQAADDIQTELAALEVILSAAVALEDEALDLAEQAADRFTDAAQATEEVARDASTAAGQASPDAPNERLDTIARDTTFAAHLRAGSADANVLAAMIHQQRIADRLAQRDTLAVAAGAGVAGADPTRYTDEALAAVQTDGLDAVKVAITTLERADRNVSADEGQWTLRAARATALFLAAQLGDTRRRAEAAEHLRALTDGQPGDPLLRPYADLLAHIESSGGGN